MLVEFATNNRLFLLFLNVNVASCERYTCIHKHEHMEREHHSIFISAVFEDFQLCFQLAENN